MTHRHSDSRRSLVEKCTLRISVESMDSQYSNPVFCRAKALSLAAYHGLASSTQPVFIAFPPCFNVCDDSLILLTTFPPFLLPLTAHYRCYKRLHLKHRKQFRLETLIQHAVYDFWTTGLSQKWKELILPTERQVQNVGAFNFLSSSPFFFVICPNFLLFLTKYFQCFYSCLSLYSLLKMRQIWKD